MEKAMNARILWADDEIDMLKPHIMFLEEKGYKIVPVNSGTEAIEKVQNELFDIVFLDEHMPGLTGLETLAQIKNMRADLPIVLITKSEEEMVMEDAIGSQISDYLIKPVNPRQILLSIKKLLENKRLVSEKVTMRYQQDFARIGMQMNEINSVDDWKEVYKKLVFWEMELTKSETETMQDVLDTQKAEANNNFSRFVEKNYLDWIGGRENLLMSQNLLYTKLLPLLEGDKPVYLILIDNLRYDQWKAIQPLISNLFRIIEDETYIAMLPTTTNYARNALFAGILPSEIEKRYPALWVNDEEEGGKNLHEEELFRQFLQRNRKDIKFSYTKITNMEAGKNLLDNIRNLETNKLNVIVYNFVDLLSHVRTEMEVIKELAEDEAAYRSLTKSWFEHSPLYDILRKISELKATLLLTTDHGSKRVYKPSRIIGDRNTTTNLRYKTGKNLNFQAKEVFVVTRPEAAGLPRQHVSSAYVFAKEDFFFVYPNNYNYYANLYKNTFQHGGISLEEMIIPVITLETK
jgi:CheY-like chemotaxis protein